MWEPFFLNGHVSNCPRRTASSGSYLGFRKHQDNTRILKGSGSDGGGYLQSHLHLLTPAGELEPITRPCVAELVRRMNRSYGRCPVFFARDCGFDGQAGPNFRHERHFVGVSAEIPAIDLGAHVLTRSPDQ